MPEIESIGILKIMCEVVEGQQAERKLDPRTKKLSSTLSCKANTDCKNRSDNVDIISTNPNMPGYFRSSMDREAEKRAS